MRNMGRLIVLVSCLLLSGLMGAKAARAADAATTAPSREVFFEALYDVPVMPGLEEVKDQAMLFDKPDGRIASVLAASKTLSVEQVSAFYGESLPQLGWKKIGQNQYVREKDRLFLEFSKKAPLTIVHFTLSPVIDRK